MDIFNCICLCNIVFPISCSLVVTCLERADPLALMYVMFCCVLVTFPYDVLGLVCYLILLIPDLCHLPYFGVSYRPNCVYEVLIKCLAKLFSEKSVVR